MPAEPWLTSAAQVVLPAVVATIMFCLGLGLRRADFDRLLWQPRLLATAFTCQLARLPLIAIARVLAPGPPLAAGLMLITACR